MPPTTKHPDQAEHDFGAFLEDPKHQHRQKPDKPDAVDEQAIGEAADWHKAGKGHPEGWHQVGEGEDATFEPDDPVHAAKLREG